MDSITIVAVASIVTAGLAITFGCLMPALGMGLAISATLKSLAQQPDAAGTISMILIFANPFWNHVIAQAAGN